MFVYGYLNRKKNKALETLLFDLLREMYGAV